MIGALFLLLAAQAGADPLAPAREGKVQCITPNREKKSCLAIASYTVRPDGSYDAVITTLINPAPLIVMETKTSGAVEDGKACGLVRQEDYAASTFKVNGADADEATAGAIRGQLLAAVGPMAGKKGCSTEKPDGDVIVSEVTLDGVARPELTQRFIWVSPADGYKVGA